MAIVEDDVGPLDGVVAGTVVLVDIELEALRETEIENEWVALSMVVEFVAEREVDEVV